MAIIAGYMLPHPPLIVPEIGRGEEEIVRETIRSYEKAAADLAALRPDTIVITSPHSVMYSDYFHISPGASAKGDFSNFRAPQLKFAFPYDTEMVQRISAIADSTSFPAGTLGERDRKLDHGTLVPLYFIQKAYEKAGIRPDFSIVRIGLSGLSLPLHYHLGQIIAQAAEELGRKTAFIGSGDLSHKLQEDGPYGFNPAGPRYDEKIMQVMGDAAFGELLRFDSNLCENAAECGHRSFVIMAGAFDRTAVQVTKLTHEDITGVGYGICIYHVTGKDPERDFLDQYAQERREASAAARQGEDPYVRLARETVESYVMSGRISLTEGAVSPEMLQKQAGAFVSIHLDGELRGCIGTIAAVQDDLSQEIMHNAISACSQDPRFLPVTEEELPFLDYSVDILGEAEDIDSPAQLDVKRYGVIVSSRGRRGLLLPDLEGVDTVEEQIRIAKRKAGIGDDQPCKLQRFEVIRHK